MDVLTITLAVLAFLVSATLAAVKLWETFWARARFVFDCLWLDEGSDHHLTLQFTIANVGHRPDGIRAITVRTPHSQDTIPNSVAGHLPILLHPRQISPVFRIDVRTDVAYDPDTYIFIGEAALAATNSAGGIALFPIPNPYSDDVHVYELETPPPPEPP